MAQRVFVYYYVMNKLVKPTVAKQNNYRIKTLQNYANVSTSLLMRVKVKLARTREQPVIYITSAHITAGQVPTSVSPTIDTIYGPTPYSLATQQASIVRVHVFVCVHLCVCVCVCAGMRACVCVCLCVYAALVSP